MSGRGWRRTRRINRVRGLVKRMMGICYHWSGRGRTRWEAYLRFDGRWASSIYLEIIFERRWYSTYLPVEGADLVLVSCYVDTQKYYDLCKCCLHRLHQMLSSSRTTTSILVQVTCVSISTPTNFARTLKLQIRTLTARTQPHVPTTPNLQSRGAIASKIST